jgi:FkbM family methyltransferase
MNEVEGFKLSKVEDQYFVIFNPEDIIQSFLINGRYYEEDMLDFIKKNYNGGNFIDCGASIGNHSLFFSKIADKVISFEPSKDVYFHFNLNKHINKIENIDIYNLCLGDEIVFVDLYVDNLSCGGASIKKIIDETTLKKIEKVFMTTLDTFNISSSVVLIKIDVEGAELKVLKGAIETIKSNKPDLFIECATEEDFNEISEFIFSLDLGYEIYEKVFNNTPTFLFSTNIKRFKDD